MFVIKEIYVDARHVIKGGLQNFALLFFFGLKKQKQTFRALKKLI